MNVSESAATGVAPAADAQRPRLFVVRHGATEWSRSGRHTGRTDVALTAEGVADAECLAGLLAGQRFALVLTSPLSRAAQTCRLAGLGEAAEATDDLLEWDYGAYEGRTTSEIRAERPGWTLWDDGVPGGETAGEVGRRVDRVIARARSVDGDTICFGHGHALRVLAARWTGLPAVGGRFLAFGTAGRGVLGWEREVAVIDRWNEPLPPR